MPWVCLIYEERPEACRTYPRPDSYIPPGCAYYFPGDGSRQGSCDQECGACCMESRVDGEPEGKPLDESMGGRPCKHLTYEE